ncbi:unnamed protein product [Urochloa humidicola]
MGAEPRGATISNSASAEWLQSAGKEGLLLRSQSLLHRLGGLQVKPLVELEPSNSLFMNAGERAHVIEVPGHLLEEHPQLCAPYSRTWNKVTPFHLLPFGLPLFSSCCQLNKQSNFFFVS